MCRERTQRVQGDKLRKVDMRYIETELDGAYMWTLLSRGRAGLLRLIVRS
jgi:hypothetical protein